MKMHRSSWPILRLMDKYATPEEYANNKVLLEVDIEKDASSRSFNDSFVSSNMDYNDLWKVTIVPSVTSRVTSSNDTIAPSTRTLSTISERGSKRDFCLPFDGNKRKKEGYYRNAEISEITSSSPTCQKLNHDYLHRSFKPDEQLISVLRGNEKESHDRMKDRINKEDTHSQICKDMNNASDAPFIELRAVYKILDFITDSDPKVASLTNNCCNEISRTLQSLLAQRHDKKLEDLLLNDSSLYRCEHCGVISYMLGPRPAIEKVKRNGTKIRHDDETVTVKHNCVNNNQNNKKSEILINSSNLRNKSQSRINDFKVNNKAKYKDELSEMESLPTKERAFVMKRSIESLNEAHNISSTEASINATIKNKFYFDNAIKKLFTDLGTGRKNKRYEYNSAAQNNPCKHKSSNAIKAYTAIDKEEVVKEILYEPKSQVDDLLARDRRSNIAQKIQASERLFNKHSDIYPVVDTVKYLARGQFTELDKKEEEFLSKLQERRFTRLEDARNGRSSVLYGSRDDYSQRDAGFWLFDESGRLPALDEYRYLPTPGMDNNRENVSSPANVSQYSRTIRTNSWSNYMEKDSLEDCALLKQRRKSDATILISSSVENLIHETMGSVDRKYEIIKTDNEDIPRGRKLVSSRPSLDIARHVRTQIAADRHSGNAKRSTGEIRTHDSSVLARLSSETRRKICHLIKAIVSSDKHSTSFRGKYLTNDMLNGKKLLRSKSVDAAFARCYKIDSEITNICADDCIPTKLSELPEDENRWPRKQNDFINTCSQNPNKSKNSIKILRENMITPICSNKSTDNSTKKIARQIVYKDVSLKNVVDNDDGRTIAEILPIYRKILENSGDMDWENFRQFVEVLHPGEKELWRDVCRTINEETRRIVGDADGNTEICIEISPVNPDETLKTGKVMTYAREIMFELDMTLKDVENFLNKRLAEERLDTHNDADENVTCWSNGGRETILKQIH